MQSDFDEKKKRQYASRRSIMDIGMGTLWLGMGCFFMLAEKLGVEINFSSPYNYLFGGLCVVYGGFRIYRGIKKNYFDRDGF